MQEFSLQQTKVLRKEVVHLQLSAPGPVKLPSAQQSPAESDGIIVQHRESTATHSGAPQTNGSIITPLGLLPVQEVTGLIVSLSLLLTVLNYPD